MCMSYEYSVQKCFSYISHLIPMYIQIAERLDVSNNEVKKVIIWGNHSSALFPDVSHATVKMTDGQTYPVHGAVGNDAWLQGEFITVSTGEIVCV